jgi:hypothetical protein
MNQQISQLEQRVRQRARVGLNTRIQRAVGEVRERFAGMNTAPAVIAVPRMAVKARSRSEHGELVEVHTLELTTKAAAEIFMAALLAERSEEEEQRALDEVLRLAEAAAAVTHD